MRFRICFGFAMLALSTATIAADYTQVTWSDAELKTVAKLSLSRLKTPEPKDLPTNRVAFNEKARHLGELLFHDIRLSVHGDTACSTCHIAEQAFAGPRIVEVPDQGPRSVPTLFGIAWQRFFFADGRKDSLWSQAIGPLTAKGEHGLSIKELARLIDKYYKAPYQELFGRIKSAAVKAGNDEVVNTIAANVGKAIAAFELTLTPPRTSFDAFADQAAAGKIASDAPLNQCAQTGLKIFIGKGFCVNCHNGPLLSNYDFHNTGAPLASMMDNAGGRMDGIRRLKSDPFNCLGPYSDHISGNECDELKHLGGMKTGTFRTPTLRQISKTAPYMHNGSIKTLEQVVAHYNNASDGPGGISELVPLRLDSTELQSLVCLLSSF